MQQSANKFLRELIVEMGQSGIWRYGPGRVRSVVKDILGVDISAVDAVYILRALGSIGDIVQSQLNDSASCPDLVDLLIDSGPVRQQRWDFQDWSDAWDAMTEPERIVVCKQLGWDELVVGFASDMLTPRQLRQLNSLWGV